MDETICGLMFRQNWWADWTILAVKVFQTCCLTNMFTQHECVTTIFSESFTGFGSLQLPHTSHIFLKSKLEIVTAVGRFSFVAQSSNKFEITPRDIVQRAGVFRAHQNRHRFLFLGGKRSCFKKQLRKWKIPVSNDGEHIFLWIFKKPIMITECWPENVW